MEKNMDTNFDFNNARRILQGDGSQYPGAGEERQTGTYQDTAEETISEEGDLDGCNSCGCIGGSTSGTQHRFLSLFFPAFTGE